MYPLGQIVVTLDRCATRPPFPRLLPALGLTLLLLPGCYSRSDMKKEQETAVDITDAAALGRPDAPAGYRGGRVPQPPLAGRECVSGSVGLDGRLYAQNRGRRREYPVSAARSAVAFGGEPHAGRARKVVLPHQGKALRRYLPGHFRHRARRHSAARQKHRAARRARYADDPLLPARHRERADFGLHLLAEERRGHSLHQNRHHRRPAAQRRAVRTWPCRCTATPRISAAPTTRP